MNKNILHTGAQEFITKYLNTDIVSVVLAGPNLDGVSAQELAQQIESKKKCQDKLPTYYHTPQIYYPNKLHIEQASSEITAGYKATLVHGKTMADLTGGLGVDTYFFAKKMESVVHCEIDGELSQIARHNFDVLGVQNITTHPVDGLDFLEHSTEKFDWAFIDPSRRNQLQKRVHLLADCIPNVPENLGKIFQKTDRILLKTAPLLDLSKGVADLKFVKSIHVVAVQNEVKEVLWVMDKSNFGEIEIKTVNFSNTGVSVFDFFLSDEKIAVPDCALPMEFLYEPNAAILKSGAFKALGNRFQLYKLHEHTHLYTSEKQISFPGRLFHIEEVIPYTKKHLQKFKGRQANISTRNFPESVATIRKKFGIKDRGGTYLFCVKNIKGEYCVLVCAKIG